MIVRIKLMGILKDRNPVNGQVSINDSATISSVLQVLEIPADSVQVFTVNGKLERDQQHALSDGDELTVLPPVGGG